jgi:glycosyltransferase involved in cell wall biosynthesis
VLYAGTVGLAQGVGTLLEAARAAGPAVEVVVAGGGAEAAALAGDPPANVRLLGVVPPAGVPALYEAAHAGVVLLRDRPLFADALPTKLLECMAAGRAVVLSARGEAAEIVERAGAGVVVAPEDPAALAAALRELAADRSRALAAGRAGRAAVAAEHSRERSVDEWLALLRRVAG